MRSLVRRPSPAMVVACIALLVALGGTSAAAVLSVPNSSVGTAQLKDNAVTAPKIAANAVTGAKINNGAVTEAKLASNAVTAPKIANNSITSSKIEDGSLLASDFAPGQLPSGGSSGGSTTVFPKLKQYRSTTAIGPGVSAEISASCPSGQQAYSGGATWNHKDAAVVLMYSGPVYNSSRGIATGWVARGRNNASSGNDFDVVVLCGKVG
jgi:hypothetical protein